MRPTITRFLLAAVACIGITGTASTVLAQTNQLDKTLVRKFPEGMCSLDSNLIGSFVTNTGIIQLSFITSLDDDGADAVAGVLSPYNHILDDISIIEESEFNTPGNTVDDPGNCYFDGLVQAYNGLVTGNPKVPFYDGFAPSTSPCPWDETQGVLIQNEHLEFIGNAGGFCQTSVVISGLTPGTPYIIHGRWSAVGFPFGTDCTVPALCMTITVDDVPNGCGTLTTESKTWGAVKALYHD